MRIPALVRSESALRTPGVVHIWENLWVAAVTDPDGYRMEVEKPD